MSYTALTELITDEDILFMAREHIQNGTIPMTTRGIGKSNIVSRILAGMIYLMNKRKD